MLDEAHDIKVIAEANDGLEAARLFQDKRPQVVVMDISMPGMDGLESAKWILLQDPEARILVLTRYHEVHYAVRAMRAGCLGYLTKGCSTKELHDAVRAVAQGKMYLSEDGKDIVNVQLLAQRPRAGHVGGLSDRELQVLCLVAQGHKLREVAAKLKLSVKTVETYHAHVLRKLCLRNDVDICRFAIENGLIDSSLQAGGSPQPLVSGNS